MPAFPLNLYQEVYGFTPQELDEISNRLGEYQMIASIYVAMTKILPKEAQIILMYYKDGMSYEEIAQTLDCSRKTVWYSKNDAVKKMRRTIIRRYLLNGIINCENELLAELEQCNDIDKEYRHQIRVLIREYDPKAYESGARTFDELKRPELIKEKLESYRDKHVWTLGLSTRPLDCLLRANINTIGELLTRTYADLMKIQAMGRKSADEIVNKITDMGLYLAE